MVSTRSTSPPKSAWPGVSRMLIFTPLCITAVFLDRMVIPRSRSRALESITRSSTRSLARKTPLCFSIASTRVVLPWSTWAIIAILRISFLIIIPFLSFIKDKKKDACQVHPFTVLLNYFIICFFRHTVNKIVLKVTEKLVRCKVMGLPSKPCINYLLIK